MLVPPRRSKEEAVGHQRVDVGMEVEAFAKGMKGEDNARNAVWTVPRLSVSWSASQQFGRVLPGGFGLAAQHARQLGDAVLGLEESDF